MGARSKAAGCLVVTVATIGCIGAVVPTQASDPGSQFWDPVWRIQREHDAARRQSPLSLPYPGDSANNLVDVLKYERLEEMRAAGLEQAKLPNAPWSGWFFPLNEGGVANRYGDPDFPRGQDVKWSAIEKYLNRTLGQGSTSNLSPAEKYDLLMGDPNFTMTRKMLQTAANHAVQDMIPAWMGYCTGWANASMVFARPQRSVTVIAADGRTYIEFRPSDIKALGALLWANGAFPTRMTGTLCQQEPPAADPVTERPYLPECQDPNPAAWHIAVVNQIGVAKRSFLIDSDPGSEIWNQPVTSYSYTYFNPETGQPAAFEQARISRNDFKHDPFAKFRAPEAASFVGVEMKVTFVYEKRPDTGSTDSPATDLAQYPVYKYDLELAPSGKIIGGEWWGHLHPDILWVSFPGILPHTLGDDLLPAPAPVWDPNRPIPEGYRKASATGAKYLQPLTSVVAHLFGWASQ